MIIHGLQPGPMLMIEHPCNLFTMCGDDFAGYRSASWCSDWFSIKPLLLVLRSKRHRC